MFIIEILNWKKYNPRSDVKEPSWFRMNHGFFDNHEFFEFTAEEKLVWIYLLCQASKKNQATVHLVELHAVHSIWPPHHDADQDADQDAHHARVIRQKTVVQAVEKLQKFGIVKIRTSRGRYADVTDSHATYERTNVRDGTNENTTAKSEFEILDFPEPKKKTTKKLPSVAPPLESGADAVAFYCDAYKTRYGHFPQIGGKQAKLLKNLMSDWHRPKFERIVTGYLAMPDAFLVQRSHPVELMETKLNEIVRFLETGKVVGRGMAQEFDKKITEAHGEQAESNAKAEAQIAEVFARKSRKEIQQ